MEELNFNSLPFPDQDGAGVRVGVIDSGVNPRHPHIHRVAGGVSMMGGDYHDGIGHGTAVMAAIQEKAPGAECFAVKLFESTLRATSEDLLRAIAWCIDNRMDVVNLSLGTGNQKHADSFRALSSRARECGVTLVCAADAGYPGCLPDVIAVAVDAECPRHTYSVRDGLFFASGYPRPVPGVPRERNLQGISFAVANMTGFVARARQAIAAADLAQQLISRSIPSQP
jgi:hypothetical protein